MKIQVVLLLMFTLFGLGFQQQVSSELAVVDDGECIEWGYEPLVDFIYPEFGESTPRPLVQTEESFLNDIEFLDAVTGYESSPPYDFLAPLSEETTTTVQPVSSTRPPSTLPSDFYAPQFEVTSPPVKQEHWELPDDFHAPQFEQAPVTQKKWDLPSDFHAPTFEVSSPPVKQEQWDLPDDFHAPQFQKVDASPVPVVQKQWDLPSDFHAPTFEVPSPSVKQEQWDLPSDFHAPQFEQVTTIKPHQESSTVGSDQYGLPDDFHAPKFEEVPASSSPQQFANHPMSANGVLGDEYGLPEYVPSQRKWEAKTKSYPESVPIEHDGFLDAGRRVSVERVDLFPDRVDVVDEFAAVKEEKERRPVKKRTRKPLSYKKHKPAAKSYRVEEIDSLRAHDDSPRVHDDFAQVDHEKTTVESVELLPSKVDVQDEFASERKEEKKHDEKRRQKHKKYESEANSWSDSLAQFFLDLVGADAPVHDAFSEGVSHKTIVEPIRDHLEPKVEVVDEFTAGSDDKKEVGGYRSKRSLAELSPNDPALWKRVCLKRRPKPASRVLTAVDFVDFAKTTNDHISRCIGRHEGESIAAGLCRKFYLRCAPTISVLMCSKMDEVFSEAQKTCVPKSELKECNLARSFKTHAISFSLSKDSQDLKPSKEELSDLANGDFTLSCVGMKDGFYRDAANCSRVLQCFDNDLFEYPPCANKLAFDLKRELCDYPEKVPSCSK